MRKFIHNLLIFILPILTYCLIVILTMPSLLSFKNGPNWKQQISSSMKNALKKDYKLFILGNSKTYRGLNPEYFTFSTYNFSNDDDSYNQIFYKLKFLIENKKDFNYLILGLDYFQFSFKSDARNFVYADFLNENYLKDFNTNIHLLKLNYYLSNANLKKILSIRHPAKKPFLKENGQYIYPGMAKESDAFQRSISRLKFQEVYFDKIISLCKSKNIKVFIVMLPMRTNEFQSYTNEEIEEFNTYIEKFSDYKGVFYLNYSEIGGFSTEDYIDLAHFTEHAANTFSKILNDDILKLIENKK